MDPSIVKLLEEDEAALNRDIEGNAPTSQPSASNTVIFLVLRNLVSNLLDKETTLLSQGSNPASSQSLAQWPTTRQDGKTNFQNQQAFESAQQKQQPLSEMKQKQQGAVVIGSQQQVQQPNVAPEELNCLTPQQKQAHDDRQLGVAEKVSFQVPQTTGIQTTENNPTPGEPERSDNQKSESKYLKLQKMSNQQASGTEQLNNPMNRGKQVPFAVLLPTLLPQLDKDKAMQLHTLYGKLKKNEIAKDGFVRYMRDIVGNQMLRLIVNKLQVQSQGVARQNAPRMPYVGGTTQFTGPHSFAQQHQKGPNSLAKSSHASSSAVHM
ncbi:hypothetical protein DITRI_Ditri10aG0051200 [Diplodiscus trichospermus]